MRGAGARVLGGAGLSLKSTHIHMIEVGEINVDVENSDDEKENDINTLVLACFRFRCFCPFVFACCTCSVLLRKSSINLLLFSHVSFWEFQLSSFSMIFFR